MRSRRPWCWLREPRGRVAYERHRIGRDRTNVHDLWEQALILTGHVADFGGVALLVSAAVRHVLDRIRQQQRQGPSTRAPADELIIIIEGPASNRQELRFTPETPQAHIENMIAAALELHDENGGLNLP